MLLFIYLLWFMTALHDQYPIAQSRQYVYICW